MSRWRQFDGDVSIRWRSHLANASEASATKNPMSYDSEVHRNASPFVYTYCNVIAAGLHDEIFRLTVDYSVTNGSTAM